mgnify:CR=1 FL=1|jgi:uncharacterized membrane protein
MLTGTTTILLKLIFIAVSVTGVLFMLTDRNYLTSMFHSIKSGLSFIPGAKPGGGYLADMFSFISSIFSNIYDKINQYALPSNPVSDSYHM